MPRAKPDKAETAERPESATQHKARLENELLSEKVRSAKLSNNSAADAHKREYSGEGDTHFNRRREADTKAVEAKSTGARQNVAHEAQMNRHAENAAAGAHHAQLQLHAHQQATHQHEQQAAAQKHEFAQHAERRAEQSHQMHMALAVQHAHAQAQAHKRAAIGSVFHALSSAAGGAPARGSHGGAVGAMHKQLGGGY